MSIWKFISAYKPKLNPRVAQLDANDKLPWPRARAARSLGAKIIKAVDDRAAIIKATPAINRDFAMPAANWEIGGHDHVSCYRLLASLKPEELRLLRFRSQNFSGNSLVIMNAGGGTSGTNPLPEGFEASWSKQRRREVIDHWINLTKGVPSRFQLNVPNMMGEVGWWYDGRIVNIDVTNYQERLTLLFRSRALEGLRAPRILEIGGGYGALALGLCDALQPCQYVICDLPESLLFAGLYLTIARSNRVRIAAPADTLKPQRTGEICLLPNYLAETLLPGEHFDLVINTLSMSEMTPLQVRTYGALISDAIGNTGAFFEQNHDNRDIGLIDCREYLAPFFRRRERIETQDIVSNRGEATIWSNI